VAPSRRWYGAGRILATVLVGNTGYTGIQAIANEDGSDGTVRIGTANLHAALVSVVFPPGSDAPAVLFHNAAGASAFAIIDGDNHSDITMKGRVSRSGVREEAILGALRVSDADFPDSTDGAFPWQSRLDARAGRAKDTSAKRQNTVVHLRDHLGEDIDDYFFEFWRSARSDKAFEQRFYEDVIDDVHVYGANRAWRSLNLDLDKFELLRADPKLGFRTLMVGVFASPAMRGNAKVGYRTATGRDIGTWPIEDRSFAKAFSPHRTLFVDLEIPRVVDDSVFRFTN
jgi:hypothetical protein